MGFKLNLKIEKWKLDRLKFCQIRNRKMFGITHQYPLYILAAVQKGTLHKGSRRIILKYIELH